MKRNTLILVAIAAALAVAVYFLEIKEGKPRDEPTSTPTTRAAFSFISADIATLIVNRAGQSTTVEDHDGKWLISQPVNAAADQSAVDSLVSALTGAKVERDLPADQEKMKSYGLEEPAVTIEIKLKSGEEHRVSLGEKDFSGLSVYALLDEAPGVALLPASILTSSDKSVDDLRDRSVLGLSQFDISSLSLKNENGQIELGKDDGKWAIKSPMSIAADETEVSSLLSEVSSAKATDFVADTDPAKYGLDKPKITLTAKLNDGSQRVLSLSSKVDENYYARNSDRPQILKVDSSLYDKLNVKLSKLRDKQIVKLNQDELTRIEIKNPNLTLTAEKDKDNKWIIKSPTDKKDKEARSNKLLDPLETKAIEVLDAPPTSASATLAKPAVEVRLTDKSGKITVLTVSSADGNDAYVRVKDRTGVYKVGKQMLDDLSFKIADVVE
jgi:hypothetical protein